jgi:hypothetical protein
MAHARRTSTSLSHDTSIVALIRKRKQMAHLRSRTLLAAPYHRCHGAQQYHSLPFDYGSNLMEHRRSCSHACATSSTSAAVSCSCDENASSCSCGYELEIRDATMVHSCHPHSHHQHNHRHRHRHGHCSCKKSDEKTEADKKKADEAKRSKKMLYYLKKGKWTT